MTLLQTNKQSASHNLWKDYLTVLVGWPAISILVLLAFFILRDIVEGHTAYTSAYDVSFLRYTVWTVIGHIAAFVLPIYLLRKSLLKLKRWLVVIIMLLGLSGQLFWRFFIASMGGIDCNNTIGDKNYNCVDTIIPKQLDATVSWIVAASLIITLILVQLYVFNKKQYNP